MLSQLSFWKPFGYDCVAQDILAHFISGLPFRKKKKKRTFTDFSIPFGVKMSEAIMFGSI